MSPFELALELTPRARLDVIDVRARAAEISGHAFDGYARCLYASRHTTAGFLPQNLAARLTSRPEAIGPYLDVVRTVFPEGAGYLHDQLELRRELAPEQVEAEPANADSHLAFIGGGLHACVSYDARRPGPVLFVDLDGTHKGVPRKRIATVVGYNDEIPVAHRTVRVPVSTHPIDAINLKDPALGIYEMLGEMIVRYGIQKGRVHIALGSGEQYASLTINEYETLLMQHDLAEVLHNPLRFAAEKARNAWADPRAVPARARGYVKYDLVRALNKLVDALGLRASRIERLVARTLEVPASRFMRMRRSVDLLVSDSAQNGSSAVIEGPYQTPILVQWRPPAHAVRTVEISLTQFS